MTTITKTWMQMNCFHVFNERRQISLSYMTTKMKTLHFREKNNDNLSDAFAAHLSYMFSAHGLVATQAFIKCFSVE